MMLGKLDVHVQENGTRSLSLTTYKTNPKWIKDLNVKSENYETTRVKG
jgi:hypothetical protein